jgi:hypothetical protein
MPRANRHFLPGHVWHIADRCHAESIGPPFKSSRFKVQEERNKPERRSFTFREFPNARPTPLLALAFRGQETLRVVGDQYIVTSNPHPPFA